MCMLLCVILPYRFAFMTCPKVLTVGFFLVLFSALVIIGGFVYCFGCTLLLF